MSDFFLYWVASFLSILVMDAIYWRPSLRRLRRENDRLKVENEMLRGVVELLSAQLDENSRGSDDR